MRNNTDLSKAIAHLAIAHSGFRGLHVEDYDGPFEGAMVYGAGVMDRVSFIFLGEDGWMVELSEVGGLSSPLPMTTDSLRAAMQWAAASDVVPA